MTGSLKGVRIAVDAMGGDFGVSVPVAGAVVAARRYGLSLILVGREAAVRAELAKADVSGLDIRVVDAVEEVGMAEKVGRPTLKKRSSILIAVELVEKGEADAFFSAGNTAACWTIAKMTLGTLPAIDRPALTAVVPNIKGRRCCSTWAPMPRASRGTSRNSGSWGASTRKRCSRSPALAWG